MTIFQTPNHTLQINPSKFVFLDALVSRSVKIHQPRPSLSQHPKIHAPCFYRDSHSPQRMSSSLPSSATASSSGLYHCSELLFLCTYGLKPHIQSCSEPQTELNQQLSKTPPKTVQSPQKSWQKSKEGCRLVFPDFGFLFLSL